MDIYKKIDFKKKLGTLFNRLSTNCLYKIRQVIFFHRNILQVSFQRQTRQSCRLFKYPMTWFIHQSHFAVFHLNYPFCYLLCPNTNFQVLFAGISFHNEHKMFGQLLLLFWHRTKNLLSVYRIGSPCLIALFRFFLFEEP